MADSHCDREEEEFWLEFWSLINQLGCLVERKKLGREMTTADLRKIAKETLKDKDAC